jgi:ppGpp synthetase/RelA/SpoT-type nucleotidyltranferase
MNISSGFTSLIDSLLDTTLPWEYSHHGLLGEMASLPVNVDIQIRRYVSRWWDLYNSLYDENGNKKQELTPLQIAIDNLINAQTDVDMNFAAELKNFKTVFPNPQEIS